MAGTIWLWNQGGGGGTSITAIVLTVAPSQPAARVDLDITAAVLTATPSLPAASIAKDTSHTATVLAITPSLPQAQVDHSLTAVVLSVTPTQPQAAVQMTSVGAVVLTVTPSLPVARVDLDITAVVLSITPSYPQASVRHHTIIRPNADVSLGNWTDELDGTTNIYLSIDETSANDADYVKSGETPSADKYRFHLSDPTDPVCSGGHSITYRYKKESAGNTMSLVVRLIENVTTIATWTETDISDTLTTTTRFLTPTEADAITDYSDLRVELEATQA